MKKILTIMLLLFATCSYAQNEVRLVVSGEGKDKNDATHKALKKAIEETFEAFVSADTTKLNQLTALDNDNLFLHGNIQKYECVNESKLINGKTSVTLSVTISLDELVSYVENKGGTAELKGGLLAMNIKKMQFEKQAEEKAIDALCRQLEPILPTLFEYKLQLEEPRLSNGKTQIDFKVFASMNENWIAFCDKLINTLKYLSLTKEDVTKYEEINNEIYYLDLAEPLSDYYYFNFNRLIKQHGFVVRPHDYSGFRCERNKDLVSGAFELTCLIPPLSSSDEEYIKNECEVVQKKYNALNDDIKKITGLQVDKAYGFRCWECIEETLKEIKKMENSPTKSDPVLESDFDYQLNGNMLFHLRSKKSIELIQNLFDKWNQQLYAVEINDDLKRNQSHIEVNAVSRYGQDSLYYHLFKGWKEYPEYEEDKPTLYSFWDGVQLLDVFTMTYYFDNSGLSKPIIWGSLSYDLEELQKVSNITVNPIVPVEVAEQKHRMAVFSNYNDSLQQAVNDYNLVLKKYPYDYSENSIDYTLSFELSDNETALRDTLHSLIQTIEKRRIELQTRYRKDSLEFLQLNNSLQERIEEANQRLLEYPYNLKKRVLKDSLSITLFGKAEELTSQLHTKVGMLQNMVEQTQKEVYDEIKKNNPQRFVEIYFSVEPNKRKIADSAYVECRCQYNNRLSFDMAFIDSKLQICDCRDKEYQEKSYLYHNKEEFNQSYNQEELLYNKEVEERKKMMDDKNMIEEILHNNKQWNLKRAKVSSNEDVKSLVSKINNHQGKCFYSDIIDIVFDLNEKLAKEWVKNGSYFKSKIEMYESWIGEEYDKLLKTKKKES